MGMGFFSRTPRKILMVEDNRNNHLLYRKAFEDGGFEVMICEDADGDFVGRVLDFKPDIISMDIMIGQSDRLAERDGFAAIELLKSDKRTADLPIIVLTNFFNDEKINRAKELGAIDYINVPGQTLKELPKHFHDYIDNPRQFVPIQPAFRE